MAQEDEEEESSLLMLLSDEHAGMLLQGINSGFPHNDV